MVLRFLMSSSKDHFVVRWDYRATEKRNNSATKFISLKAGTIVRLIKFHRRLNEDGSEKKIQHIAEISVVKNRFQKGFIHIAFLQPLFTFGFPISSAGLEYQKYYGIDERLWDCRWYLAYANPIYVSIKLRSDSSAPFGSFVVIGNSEMDSRMKKHWKNLLLIVKWYSGSLAAFLQEHKRNILHSELYNGTPVTSKDRRPLDDSASNGIAFIPIQRTQTGKFFINQQKVFSSIFSLLSFYFGRRLPLCTGPALTLTQPFQILDKSVRGLPPHCHKKPGTQYKMPPNCSGLFVQNVINKQRFLTSLEIDKESSSLLGKTFYGIVRDGNEAAEIAAVKLLNKYWFDQGSFAADLALLKLSERKNNEALKPHNRNTYYIHGSEYLAKIVAHSHPQKIASPFVAYEFFPNLSIYDSLEYGRKFSYRTILEIMYQVAGAMFHLEINGLCHRSLCANNVIIHWDDEVSVSIKVTDYMLPSHHFVSKIDREGDEKGIKPIKWQWMSPESIFHGIMDIVSDSWSFGCFIFELINEGAIPYSYESPAIKNIDL
uniref:Non-specific protein-tyrosine kinase n=1 Tax=Panagrolaimus superbus TaxID=310955 RepID=A0A914Z0V5_9BILA